MEELLKTGAISHAILSLNMSPSTKRERIGDLGAKFIHNNEIGYVTCEKGIEQEWYIKENNEWHSADFVKEGINYELRRVN